MNFIFHLICFNHSLEGQEIILYIIYRKYSEFNCYECEIIINYSTDTLDYIYQTIENFLETQNKEIKKTQ